MQFIRNNHILTSLILLSTIFLGACSSLYNSPMCDWLYRYRDYSEEELRQKLATAIKQGGDPNTTCSRTVSIPGGNYNLGIGSSSEKQISLLTTATLSGRYKIAELLIDAGANVNSASTSSGESILFAAIRYKDFEAVKFLISKGAEASSGLKAALLENDESSLAFLLANGANPNFVFYPSGILPIHFLADRAPYAKFFTKALDKLIASGGDINAIDSSPKGNTPLHYLVSSYSLTPHELNLVKILLSRGARIDIKNHSNKTPLQIVEERRGENVEMLRLMKSRRKT